ncbi:hypothetical protein PCC8801_2384 [Rippkaea orientalis PCC 8801]|uniref:PEP-CTERM protein-sorting domain-containing protein n=1 Tax=Rippkaea orientalis (strain PCC 8801 / RF-1) TaxID=41431 RepID=B7K2K2_RIPO1|nr:hypothetical protein [Rippkaea orientalis]ACK66395.1 hypothetical protein PCC8801_2384 [Rippkaea orientalis PCC 8801]
MKTLLTQLSIATALLGIVAPAYSASISFRPAGQQLDSDPMNDLGVSVGQQFTFFLSIDTTGLSSNLKSFTYRITRDNTEILLEVATITPEADALFTRNAISDIPTPPSLTVGTVLYEIKPGETFAPDSQLDFATATYVVQPGLVNDGLADYQIELIEAIDEQDNNITSQFVTSQTLDLQPVPEGSSTLGFLALGTLSAASTLKRKLKPSQKDKTTVLN